MLICRRNFPFLGHIYSYEHMRTHTLINKECSLHSSCLYSSCSDPQIFQLMHSHAAQFLSCSLDADIFSKSTCNLDQMNSGLFNRPFFYPGKKNQTVMYFAYAFHLNAHSLISCSHVFVTAGTFLRTQIILSAHWFAASSIKCKQK